MKHLRNYDSEPVPHFFGPMIIEHSRRLLAHATPILLAQLISMGMMVIDTILLGHHSTADLAAVAVGSGIYISIVFALAGILQAVAPIAAQLHGAGRHDEIAAALQQALWLALLLAVPGVLLLTHPQPLLSLSTIDALVEEKTRQYLRALACGLPALLFYRTFHAFCNALGHPRPLLWISLGNTALHGLLATALVSGRWGGEPLGALGCGVSNAIVSVFAMICALVYLRFSLALRPFRLFDNWRWPQRCSLSELLRLGLPMGCSNLIEISSFTLMALFVAPLGATALAGHRIVANLAAICYMLPLAVGIATLAQVAQAIGGGHRRSARSSIVASLLLSSGLSMAVGGLLWWFGQPLTMLYTDDPAVWTVSLSLLGYVAVYQIFDAVQTIAAHALRGCRVTFAPMLVHLICFWGVGLFGGWWLAYHVAEPWGVAGFWFASLVSLILASVLLAGLLWQVIRSVGDH
ncbi:MAG: MATE family efflux transporter [Candidatus Accumulibacter sp.]|nr:MATE family efflux transporter [Accumulibacter sp.]